MAVFQIQEAKQRDGTKYCLQYLEMVCILFAVSISSLCSAEWQVHAWQGGKVDDITIIVAYVDEEAFTPDQARQLASGIV